MCEALSERSMPFLAAVSRLQCAVFNLRITCIHTSLRGTPSQQDPGNLGRVFGGLLEDSFNFVVRTRGNANQCWSCPSKFVSGLAYLKHWVQISTSCANRAYKIIRILMAAPFSRWLPIAIIRLVDV